jgi:enoyl-[acyl-carrier protein] reductase I
VLDENSIAWKTAERIYEEGGVFVLTNAQLQLYGFYCWIGSKTGSTIIPADATSVTDLENLVDQAVAILGGKIDFVLHSIGMSVNVRKGNHYTNQNYEYTERDGMCQLFL